MTTFRRLTLAAFLVVLMAPAGAKAQGGAPAAAPAPALDPGLGAAHFAITTRVPDAQKYFDQGVRLLFAFNPEEAERAFRHAAELDPACAMANWGIAISNGNNINVPRLPWRDSTEYVYAQKALAMKAQASPREQALIEALGKRALATLPEKPDDQHALDVAYGDAMRAVAKQFPNDPDVLTFFAEALMEEYPWHLYGPGPDLKPSPITEECVATLEHALKVAPKHLGANHLYIHAVEGSGHPEKGVASAERLVNQTPDAGHLLHMPSHIFERVGRYAEATQVNRDAVACDVKYFAQPTAGMLYTPYLAHNRQFIAYCAMIEGRYGEAVKLAHDAASTIPLEMNAMMPGMDFFRVTPYAVEVKFGRWDDALAEPAPPASLLYTAAYWHFARGMAFTAKKQATEAKVERDSLVFLRDALAPDAQEGVNSARALLGMCLATLDGATARVNGDLPGAIAQYRTVVESEKTLQYNEPPDWLLFPRHDLGNALLEAGKPAEAEAVFRDDLAIRANTGWGLTGLAQALAAEKKTAEAAKVTARCAQAWKNADTKIATAAY